MTPTELASVLGVTVQALGVRFFKLAAHLPLTPEQEEALRSSPGPGRRVQYAEDEKREKARLSRQERRAAEKETKAKIALDNFSD